MTKASLIFTLIVAFLPLNLFSQTIFLNSNQMMPLVANAGYDKTILSDESVVIGGNPTAMEGYGSYIYLWTPSDGLDDPTKANPIASPSVTTKYLLTITDLNNCTAVDEVKISVNTTGIATTVDTVDFKVYPNPTKGIINFDFEGNSGFVILRLISPTGAVIHEIKKKSCYYFHEEFDTRLYSKGNYMAMLIYNNTVITKTVIIM